MRGARLTIALGLLMLFLIPSSAQVCDQLDTCISCPTSSSVCQECTVMLEENQIYLDKEDNTCKQCSVKDNYFFKSADQGCALCPDIIPNCQTCEVGEDGREVLCTSCLKNADGSQFKNVDSKQCIECEDGTFLNLAGTSCEQCSDIITGCSSCMVGDEGTQCELCQKNKAGVQFKQVSPIQCQPCSGETDTGKFLNDDGDECQLCSSALPGCKQCSVGDQGTECLECSIYDNGLQFQLVEKKCQECDSASLYYLDLESGECKLCSEIIDGCQTCEASAVGTNCEICHPLDNDKQYARIDQITCQQCVDPNFLTRSGTSCAVCNEVILGCEQCSKGSSQTQCTKCVPALHGIQFALDGSSCIHCDSSHLLYRNEDGTSCEACSAIIQGCSSCIIDSEGLTKCEQCYSYSQDGEQYQLENGGCKKCSETQQYLSTSNQCANCGDIITNCGVCAATETGTICSQCNPKDESGTQYYKIDDYTCEACLSSEFLTLDGLGCSDCESIIPDCEVCIVGTGSTQCSECKYQEGSQYALTTLTQCTPCIGTYLTADGTSCASCDVAVEGCKTCSADADGTFCSECKIYDQSTQKHYIKETGSRVCTACTGETPYYEQNTCKSCSAIVTNCIQCQRTSLGTLCTKCDPNVGGTQYYLDGSEECLPCTGDNYLNENGDGCSACDSIFPLPCTDCSVGLSGTQCGACQFLYNDNHHYLQDGQCQSCEGQFLQTPGSTLCQSCQDIFDFCIFTGCTRSQTGTQCIPVTCDINTDSVQELELDGYSCEYCFPHQNQWKVLAPEFGCAACDVVIEKCGKCKAEGVGTVCEYCKAEDGESYKLSANKQSCSVCPNNQYVAKYVDSSDNQKQCQACEDIIQGCTACAVIDGQSSVVCTQCKGTSSPDGVQSNYFLNDDGTCTRCEGENGYFVNDNNDGCDACGSILAYCTACGIDSDDKQKAICTECDKSEGAYLDGQQCTLCQSQGINQHPNKDGDGCQLCSSFYPNCDQCEDTVDGPLCSSCVIFHDNKQYSLNDEKDQCSQCDPDAYLDSENENCVDCDTAIPGCTQCNTDETGTICDTCTSTLTQQYAKVDKDCVPCTPDKEYLNEAGTECLSCSGAVEHCKTCQIQEGTFVTSCTKCLPLSTHKQFFLDGDECTQCIEDDGQYLNEDQDGCDQCSLIIDNCVACGKQKTGTVCTQCGSDDKSKPYAVASDGLSCVYCNPVSEAIDPSTQKCIPCDTFEKGCVSCLDTQCIECNKNEDGVQYAFDEGKCVQCLFPSYLDDTKYGCELCEGIIPHCGECYVTDERTECRACMLNFEGIQYYFSDERECSACEPDTFLNAAKSGCASCDKAIIGCISCQVGDDGTICLECSSNLNGIAFALVGTTCQMCNHGEGNYLKPDGASCAACDEAIPGCLSCVVGAEKTQCEKCAPEKEGEQYYLQQKTCIWCEDQYLGHNICDDCALIIEGCQECRAGPAETECVRCDRYQNSQQTLVIDNACGPCGENTYLNDEGTVCLACQVVIAGCTQCQVDSTGYTKCTECNPNHEGHQFSLQEGKCVMCDVLEGEYLSLDQTECLQCEQFSTGCLECQIGADGTQCLSCNRWLEDIQYALVDDICEDCTSSGNYLTLGEDGCQVCGSVIVGCQFCFANEDGSFCLDCEQGEQYYLTSFTQCTQCDNSQQQWLTQSLNGCDTCGKIIQNCLSCSKDDVGTLCTRCDESKQLYVSDSSDECVQCQNDQDLWLNNDECQPCSDVIDYCKTCGRGIEGTICSACNDKTQRYQYSLLSQLECLQCDNQSPEWLSIDETECDVCSEVIPGCETCAQDSEGKTICSVCDSANHYFKNTDNYCTKCEEGLVLNEDGDACTSCHQAMLGCVKCDTYNQCTECHEEEDFFPNDQNSCSKCSLIGCNDCSTASTCSQCNEAEDYFISEGACGRCGIPGCQKCSDLNVCTSCHTSENYFLIEADGVCKMCDLAGCSKCTSLQECQTCKESLDYFLTQENICQRCTLTACTDCKSLTECLACDTEEDYFLNEETGLCEKCTLTACSSCKTSTQCRECETEEDYFLNDAELCQKCNLLACTDCKSLTQCEICLTEEDYFLNDEKLCEKCDLTACVDCKSFTECQVCITEEDYFLNDEKLCEKCDLTGCTDCKSLTECQICDTEEDYFLNQQTGLCEKCTLTACTDCKSSTQCEACLTEEDYFLNDEKLCQECDLLACTDCKSLTECQACDTEEDYFLTEQKLCQKCMIPACSDCESLTVCKTCDTSLDFFLAQGICEKCQLKGCLDCLSLTECQTCDNTHDYFLESQTCSRCDLTSCLKCKSLSECETCDESEDYFLQDGLCQECNLKGCLDCSSLSVCQQCDEDNDYFLADGVCVKCDLTGCLDCKDLSSCEPDSCNSAINYYYQESTEACSIDCLYPCKACIGPASACLSCVPDFALVGYTCVSMQEGGSGSMEMTGSDGSIAVECSGGCLVCSEPNFCDACDAGYLLNEGKCESCPSNCMLCQDTCNQCFPRNALNEETGECESCPQNCAECTVDACTACLQGFYVGEDGECQPCGENCEKCSETGACEECAPRYTVSQGQCVECMSGCGSCSMDDFTKCSRCSVGYYFQDDTCQRCSIGCSKCKAENYCQECSGGYFLDEVTLTCSKSCEFPCETCVKDQPYTCQSCFGGYKLDGNKCSLDIETCNEERNCEYCPRKFALTLFNTCEDCGFSHCDFCDLLPEKVCTKCENGYYLDGNKECQQCPEGCSSCKSPDFCSVCSSNYFMVRNEEGLTGKCSQCSSENFCKECQHSASQCTECQDGYEFLGLKCASAKRVKAIMTLRGQIEDFPPRKRQTEEDILKILGSKYEGKHHLISLTKLEKGSVKAESEITVAEDDTIAKAFDRLETGLNNADQIGGMKVESSEVEGIGYSRPVPEEQQEISIAIFIVIPIVLVIIILVIVVTIRMKKSEEKYSHKESDEKLGDSGKDLNNAIRENIH